MTHLGARRTVRVDARALTQARASEVLAVDPRIFGGVVALAAQAPGPVGPTEGTSVAVVAIDGPLAQRAVDDLCAYVDGYDAVTARVLAALNDARVGAVVLRIDSPGGDVAGLEEAVRRISEARAAKGKPIFSFVDEHAFSAAYWLAAGVSDGGVFLPPAAHLGSIGCIGAIVDETAALEAEGIKVTLVRDPAGKAASHPAGPIADIALARMTELVARASARFVEGIAQARRIAAADIRALDGGTLEGQAAVDAGLADGVDTLEGVIAKAAAAAEENKSNMSTAKALGLDEKATAQEIQSAVEKLTAKAREDAPFVKLGAAVLALTGEPTADAAEGKVGAWKVSHESAQTERATRAAVERDELVAKMVALGWERPAQAWANPIDANDKAKRKPAEPWASMAIETLRARVEALGEQPRGPLGPETPTGNAQGLTADQLRICAETGCKPEVFARIKSQMGRAA